VVQPHELEQVDGAKYRLGALGDTCRVFALRFNIHNMNSGKA
jgi:hypothetical protein